MKTTDCSLQGHLSAGIGGKRPVVTRPYWFDDRLRLALLKESASYRKFWQEHGGRETIGFCRDFSVLEGDNIQEVPAEKKLRSDAFDDGLQDDFGLEVTDYADTELENLLDPFNHDLPNKDQPEKMPLFFEKAVPLMQVIDFDDENGAPIEGEHYLPKSFVERLGPSQRMLVVDLACRKKDLVAAFEKYLDEVKACRDWVNGLPEEPYKTNYQQWSSETERERKEVWRHLKVWQSRRQGKPFFRIATETGITIDQAKDSFTRAFELIEGGKYDRELYRGLYLETLAAEVVTPCQRCKDAASCDPKNDPCPDLLDYWLYGDGAFCVSQVEGGRRERFIDDLAPEKQRKISAF